jgi:hypothetical protein
MYGSEGYNAEDIKFVDRVQLHVSPPKLKFADQLAQCQEKTRFLVITSHAAHLFCVPDETSIKKHNDSDKPDCEQDTSTQTDSDAKQSSEDEL